MVDKSKSVIFLGVITNAEAQVVAYRVYCTWLDEIRDLPPLLMNLLWAKGGKFREPKVHFMGAITANKVRTYSGAKPHTIETNKPYFYSSEGTLIELKVNQQGQVSYPTEALHVYRVIDDTVYGTREWDVIDIVTGLRAVLSTQELVDKVQAGCEISNSQYKSQEVLMERLSEPKLYLADDSFIHLTTESDFDSDMADLQLDDFRVTLVKDCICLMDVGEQNWKYYMKRYNDAYLSVDGNFLFVQEEAAPFDFATPAHLQKFAVASFAYTSKNISAEVSKALPTPSSYTQSSYFTTTNRGITAVYYFNNKPLFIKVMMMDSKPTQEVYNLFKLPQKFETERSSILNTIGAGKGYAIYNLTKKEA